MLRRHLILFDRVERHLQLPLDVRDDAVLMAHDARVSELIRCFIQNDADEHLRTEHIVDGGLHAADIGPSAEFNHRLIEAVDEVDRVLALRDGVVTSKSRHQILLLSSFAHHFVEVRI